MKLRKPNRVTTPKRAVENGKRTNHASAPRSTGRWALGKRRLVGSSEPPKVLCERAGGPVTRG